jgi:hypothetical protein
MAPLFLFGDCRRVRGGEGFGVGSLGHEHLYIANRLFQFPPYQTKTSVQLWQGVAHVRIFLVSDKYQ